MKRILSISALGLCAALIAHFAWFELRRPEALPKDGNDLAWMKAELKLSDEQYQRVCSIHRESSAQMVALSEKVRRMRTELETFEQDRLAKGEVDFLEFAHFVELRRAVDKQCQSSTREIVQATAAVMTPTQRERYLSIVGTNPAERPSQPTDRSQRL